SAHYALLADDTPLDVLPGLYGPQQFLAWLDSIEKLHARALPLAQAERMALLRRYHQDQASTILRAWDADLRAVQPSVRRDSKPRSAAFEQMTTDEVWNKIALLPPRGVQLDAASQAIIRREKPTAARAGALAATKRAVEDPILALVRTLQASIALDSVRNE